MSFPLPFRGRVYNHITECIGHTPLVKLHRVVGDAKATNAGKLIVAVLPGLGERYLSTPLFPE